MRVVPEGRQSRIKCCGGVQIIKTINPMCILLTSFQAPGGTTFGSGLNRIQKCQIQCALCPHGPKRSRFGSHLSSVKTAERD